MGRHFAEEIFMYIFLNGEVCCHGFSWWQVRISSGNCFPPNHNIHCSPILRSTITFFPVTGQPYFPGVLCAITTWNQGGDHTSNIRPVFIQKILFGSQVMGFLRGRCWKLLGCQKVPSKESYALFVGATILPRGYVGICWRWSHQKKTVSFSVSRGKGDFSQLLGNVSLST